MQRKTSKGVLIIEDEPLIAMDIARLVGEMGHLVCGSAAGRDEAIRLARETHPQLVLADIQLKGGDSGILTVQEILRSIDVPVIFVTGFPERLLTGERLEPAFVLSKPFKPEVRSEEHTSELQSLMRISYAVFCLKKKKNNTTDICSRCESNK